MAHCHSSDVSHYNTNYYTKSFCKKITSCYCKITEWIWVEISKKRFGYLLLLIIALLKFVFNLINIL